MRVLQTKIPTAWVNKSNSPADSVAALVCCCDDLVDDQRLITRVEELKVNVLSTDAAAVFIAKDADTLVRGFSYVAKATKGKGIAYVLRSGDGSSLSIWGAEWHKDVNLRYHNKVTAGLTTVGSNLLEFGKRQITGLALRVDNMLIRDMEEDWKKNYKKRRNDALQGIMNHQRYTSLSEAMAIVGRDGRLARTGAFVYVCRTFDMLRNIHHGKVQNEIPDTLTMAELAVKSRQLLGV